ncbi:tetratricopeptide repeat protein [Planctomycetes bacterium Pan216]
MTQALSKAARGFMYLQSGEVNEAERLLEEAQREDPNNSEIPFMLAMVARQRGDLDQAIARLRDVVRAHRGNPQAHFQLGLTLAGQGSFDEAIQALNDCLALTPNFTDARFQLGRIYASCGRWQESLASLEDALRLDPKSVPIHEFMGQLLTTLGQMDRAMSHFQTVVDLQPNSADAQCNLGAAYVNAMRFEEAAACLNRSLQMDPNSAETHHNIGVMLTSQGEPEQALPYLRKSLELQQDFAPALNSLGAALQKCGRIQEALESYDKACELIPKYPDARFNAAQMRLLLGDLEKGFEEYEWRWAHAPMRPFSQPFWDGSSLRGQTILLHAERGIGDTLQFLRYALLVKQQGARVLVECQPELTPLLRLTPGIDQLIPQGEPLPHFDVHAPLLSLPRIFKTTLESIPVPIPYLFPRDELVDHWATRLPKSGFRVGIAWQGNPDFREDADRSIPLAAFEPLSRVPGITLINLQKGHGRDQLDQFSQTWPIVDLGLDVDESSGPFMDTAAIASQLDLIITSDSAIPHLAGALGVPVWVALPIACDWRFMLERADSPWYPTMRLFRQTQRGDWGGLFAEIAMVLETLTSSVPQTTSVSINVSPAELFDRLTLLELADETTTDPATRSRLQQQREELTRRASLLGDPAEIMPILSELRETHRLLHEAHRRLRDVDLASPESPMLRDAVETIRSATAKRADVCGRIDGLFGSDRVPIGW